jgi:hypothetical protein
MTTVNWEREPGEKIEEFVAAMLLLEHRHGNHITPSGPVVLRVGMIEAGLSSEVIDPLSPVAASKLRAFDRLPCAGSRRSPGSGSRRK